MKVSKLQASENREAIIQTAAAQIRDRGFGQMSVAEVAKAAGLTHGALYSHFDSKDALQTEATERAFAECRAVFANMDAGKFLERYLSLRHRDHPEQGCPVSALVTEVRWQSEGARAAFAAGLQGFAALTERCLHLTTVEDGRDRAILALAAMAGGVAMARAVRDVDEVASANILRAVDEQLRGLVAIWTQDDSAAPPAPKRRRSGGKPGRKPRR